MTDEQRTKVIDAALTLGRLRELQDAYVGGPMPEWMPVNLWGTVLSELAGDAADLIEWFQSGKLPSRDIGCGTAVIEPWREADDLVTYICRWCEMVNTQPRGQCRCLKCGQPRGSRNNE